MSLIADGLLLIAAGSAAVYCAILSRRLSRLSGLDAGLGKAIVSLTSRVDEMKTALADAKRTTEEAQRALALKVDLAARQAQDLSALIEQAAQAANALDGAASDRRANAEAAAEAAASAERLVKAVQEAAKADPEPESAPVEAAAPAAARVEEPVSRVTPEPASEPPRSTTSVAAPSAPAVEMTPEEPEAEPEEAVAEPVIRSAPRKPLSDSLEVIRRARDSDDDEAFAARLVDALSALQPAGAAGAR